MNTLKEKEKENFNILKDYDLHTEKEVTLFDNFNIDDEMNMSMNTFKLDRKEVKRNILKFTCKRKNPSENNIQSDLISNISFNTQTKEKGNFLNQKNKFHKKPENSFGNLEYKSIYEKQNTPNFVKKNTSDNNIIVIENLSQNEDLNPKNTKINNINENFNEKINNKKIGNILGNKIEDFNFHCDELFKKFESNLKEKEKIIKFQKNSEEIFCIEDLDKNKNFDLKKRIESELSNKEEENKGLDIDISSNLILSYKKIFSNNKLYMKKIMEDFLKKNENEANNLSKIEKNAEASVLYNIKSAEENKSNFHSKQINNENLSVLNDDFCSVNKNLNLDNTIEEKFGGLCPKNYNKIKNGFMNSTLKAIYYEKINLELLSKILLDLKIFHEESEYRKKLKNNFPKFINIFEDYLRLLEDLKKIKFRRENEEKGNINRKNFHKIKHNDVFIRKESIQKRRKSADSLIKVNKFDFIEENFDIKEKIIFTSENIEEDNTHSNIYLPNNFGNYKSINAKKKTNMIKSISNKKSSALQTNLTFNNYNLLMSNRITYSNNIEGFNNIISDMINCPACNKTFKINNINSNKSFKENSGGIPVAPFKLHNNENTTTEEREYFALANSPEKTKKNLLEDFTIKESDNLLSQNINLISPDRDFNKNSNDNRKYTLSELNNINSFSNTPVNKGFKTFNLSNSNLNGSSVKGKLENIRASNLSIGSNMKNNNNDENNYLNEFLLVKKENILYKNCFDSFTNEYNNFKLFEKNKEEAILKFYEENKTIFEKEVNCFWRALKVYKEIFTDSINIKENKISEMSKVFDEMVKGENSVLMNTTNYNNTINNIQTNKDTYSNFQTDKSDTGKLKEDFLKNLAIKKKNSVIKGENENKDKEFLKLAEAFYKEEGTATKKLDYVSIQMNSTNDTVSLKYGSGLNKNIPTRSPLYKGFNNPLKGDDDDDDLNDN